MSRIPITVRHRYLVFPIGDCRVVRTKKVRFFLDDTLVFDFDSPIDIYRPVHRIFVDVNEYIGRNLTVEIDMPAVCPVRQADERLPPSAEAAPYRPHLHYTAPFGWLNDPNGLVYYTSPVTGKTVWHMFYQHNPYGIRWGNMSWGHCISSDLIHWKTCEPVLSPDSLGAMYSGSAVIDSQNVSGLKEGREDPILLFYTAAGSNNELSAGCSCTQCLAYSSDGGRTFRKYENNPILPHISARNRDPKVVYCVELNSWLMALYLEESIYCLLRSSDLLHWTEFQRLTLPGDRECPDFFPIETTGENSERVWVFRGASQCFSVLKESNGLFELLQPSEKHFFGISYAPQTFFGTEKRHIAIAWEKDLFFPDSAYMSQMSIPYELSLRKEGGHYLLCSNPVREFDSSAGTVTEYREVLLNAGKPVVFPLEPGACDITLEFQTTDRIITFEMFGNRFTLNFQTGEAVFENSSFPILYPEMKNLRLIVDTCSCTFFSGDGRLGAAVPFVCDDNLNELSVSSDAKTVLPCIQIKMAETTQGCGVQENGAVI